MFVGACVVCAGVDRNKSPWDHLIALQLRVCDGSIYSASLAVVIA